MDALADFKLFYEFISDEDQQRFLDWQRQDRQARRDLLAWARHQIFITWMLCTTRRPRNGYKAGK